MSTIFSLLLQHDTGPIYKETHMGRFPVEPWNTASNFIFLFIILFWGVKVFKNSKNHKFLTFAIPIIGLGFIGGTIYHATRSHEAWLLMDWVPIMFLCFSAVIYFSAKCIRQKWKLLLWLVGLFSLPFLIRLLPFPEWIRISLGYVIVSAMMFVPICWYLIRSQWQHAVNIFVAFGVFALAILFRSMDKHYELFPMGTHWLWHLLGGIAVFFLIRFIYKDDITIGARRQKPLR